MKNILVVGSGGREAAIVCALNKNKEVDVYGFLSNKNPQIIKNCKDFVVGDILDSNQIISFVKDNHVSLVYLSPDAVLEKGIADDLFDAEKKAQMICEKIKGDVWFRKDIGTKEIIEKKQNHMKEIKEKII